MKDEPSPDFSELIPELAQWNDGSGIDAEMWIRHVGNYELATGYSLIFWPRFVQFDGYVLHEGFSVETLRVFEEMATDRWSVEAVMNHLHIADLHYNSKASTSQIRHLGRLLKDIYEVKLRRDFPDARFTVDFDDEDGLDDVEYELSFWQSSG